MSDSFATNMFEAVFKSGSQYSSLFGGAQGVVAGIIMFSGIAWMFGYLGGQPQLNVRFMAIKDMKQARVGRNIGIVWTLLAYTGGLMIGWLGLAIFGPQAISDREQIMPLVMLKIFPPVVAALLISGAIAAMISTADSLLVLSATEFSNNIVIPFLNKLKVNVSELVCSRLVTISLAIIALCLGYLVPSQLIYTIVSFVWAGIGGTFSIVIIFSLFWPRFHSIAALWTIIIGLSFTIVWILLGLEKVITTRILTFIVAGVCAIILTLMLKPKAINKL